MVARLLKVLLEVTGTQWSEEVIAFAIARLSQYPEEQVVQALKELIESAKYRISLADILEKLPSIDEWLPVEEAWLRALQLQDEAKSVIICDEISVAWGVASMLYEDKLKTEAKRVFENRYMELVRKAKAEGRRPAWYISYGTSVELRAEAEREAIKRGLISEAQAIHLLPHTGQALPMIAELAEKMNAEV